MRQCVAVSLERHLMLFPILGTELKDMQTEQLLRWNGMTDTEYTQSGSNEVVDLLATQLQFDIVYATPAPCLINMLIWFHFLSEWWIKMQTTFREARPNAPPPIVYSFVSSFVLISKRDW